MKIIQIGLHGKARVWFDEAPRAMYTPTRIVTCVVSGCQPSVETRAPRRVAAELFVPRGAHSEYGLVGGHFVADDCDRITTRVSVSSPDGASFSGSLASSVDDVRIGLPEEYTERVLTSASACAGKSLPSGALTIDDAAHGIVGSNRKVFGWLARLIVGLLGARADLSDVALMTIIQETETTSR